MNIKEVPLKRLSICKCGDNLLRDEIKLGTIYMLDMDSLRDGFSLMCGSCGQVVRNVVVVKASQHLNRDLPFAYLPVDLFDLPNN